MPNCNCLISAPLAGQHNGLVVPQMRSSPSHDGRGDAEGGGALPDDIRAAGEAAVEDGEEVASQNAISSTCISDDGGIDDDAGIEILDVQIGNPSGLQDKYRKSAKNATQASVAVKDQSEVDIKRSFHWAFTHGNKEIKPTYGAVDHRQESLIQSFQRRFPLLSEHFRRSCPSSGRCVPVLYPALRYKVSDIGVEVIFVQTLEDRDRCLRFCKERRAVSIDTEAAPLNRNIDLVQIGDRNQVFLCPLRNQDPQFLNEVAEAIFQDAHKTVYQFGSDDVAKFLHSIGKLMDVVCTQVNVQDRLRELANLPPHKPPSLFDAVATRYGNGRFLSKAWTISGWDNIPLHQDQAEYAALDALFAFELGSELK